MTRRVNNDRGLGRYGESDVIDSRRQTIRIQDSSACSDDGPCVWIFCNDEDGRDFVEHPPAPRGIVVRSPHLTAKQAVEVANRLLEFVELAAPEALEAAVIPGRPDFHETCRNYESALDYGVQEAMDITAENERLRAELAAMTERAEKAERERDEARALLVQRGMEIDALVSEKRDAVAAFHDASRLRSQIQAERIKAEDERDARPMITVEDAAAWLRGTRNEATMDDEAGQIRLRDALRAHAAAPKDTSDGGAR